MLAVVCASAAEAKAIKHRIQITGQINYQEALVIKGCLRGREIVFVQTGVGPKRAKSAAHYIAEHIKPSCAVLIGAAGAVDPRLQVGDIVITNKILRKEGPIHDTRSTGIFNIYYCDATLSSIASERIKQAGFSPVPGDCLTTERFVHRREKKAWIHSIFNVHVVEMESIALAAVFNAAHIPFINVRVVSDTSMKTIVNYEAVVALRRKSGWGGIADYFLRNPGEIMRGVQFRINMLKAKKTMLQVVTILVNGLPDTI